MNIRNSGLFRLLDGIPFRTAPLRVALVALVLLSAVFVGSFAPLELPNHLSIVAGVVIVTVGLLATAAIPEQLTILIFFLVAMVFTVSTPEIVFSGFNSSAFWLVFGGLIIGAAVESTGLGRRIAKSIMRHIRRGQYATVVAAVVFINCVLIFLMPSTLSRVVLLIPVVISLAGELGYEEGGEPRNGLVMATVLTAYLCSTSVLPANVPNNVLMGAAETALGFPIRYFDYFLLHFPILGFLKAFVIWGCIVVIFRPKTEEQKKSKILNERIANNYEFFTRDEKRLLIFLICALFLWASDVLHGIAPAWISLAIGIICLFPRIGIISASIFKEKVQVAPLLYVAGIIGIGAVVSDSGLGAFVSEIMVKLSHLSPEEPIEGFFVLSGIAMMLSFFSTMPGVPAIMVPLAPDLQVASGLPLKTVLMTQVVGFSTVWLPYQVPPIIIGMQLARVPMKAGLQITAIIGLVSIIILSPLLVLWWQFLGYLPVGSG
ncbi:MAG: sodium:sulfate symporter [Rhodospirillaceae bacterium]|nr:sodium:sulfate symporter [Rhodospirillaceae bacterium]